jgi:16S rRNA (guanine1516-N2)-methyltransferase
MVTPSIAVFAESPALNTKAQELAIQLHLPVVSENTNHHDYLLIVTPDYIGLKKTGMKSNPLYIDFLSEKMRQRLKQATVRKEMLARALGLKSTVSKYIVDATTGLARDSFILAKLGCKVTALERSPIIYILIKDGIQRAAKNSEYAGIMQRLCLINTDSIQWLSAPNIKQQPEIVYLDPMFPERQKSALSKQDMRIFHEVVGNDLDASALLKAALACATERVVVKRPRLAPPIANLKPAFSMEGSSNRFDIYLIKRDSHGHTAPAG